MFRKRSTAHQHTTFVRRRQGGPVALWGKGVGHGESWQAVCSDCRPGSDSRLGHPQVNKEDAERIAGAHAKERSTGIAW